MTKLRDLKAGDVARVLGFGRGDKAYRKRLLAMGLTPGVEFQVVRVAPFGGPVQIGVRGFSLSLRRDEAESLLLQRA